MTSTTLALSNNCLMMVVISFSSNWDNFFRTADYGHNRGGGGEYTSVKWAVVTKNMESLPILGLGTINITFFCRMTDLTTRTHVRSLGIGMGRC